MALLVKDRSSETTWLQEWSIPGLPPFIPSQNLETLQRELGRYVRGEVDGRSFLIAGHRGSGKTSLVRRAIEDFRQQIIRDCFAPGGYGRMSAPQRPLMVKLHGPSLLAEPKAGGVADSWPKPGTLAGDPEQVTLTFKPGAAASAPRPDADAPPPASTARTALIQITIALYRALAREAAETYGVHAREDYRNVPGDQLELAGQLVLELDRAPEPGALRSFWSRLKRLGPGVLWPNGAAWLLDDIGSTSQGVREVVALATAAQAYQVCSGDVSDKQVDTDRASREETVASAAGINLTHWLNRLIGVAVGGVAGAVLGLTDDPAVAANRAPIAIAGALAAGLVTALTLDWTSKRQVKREKTRDYSFILDRSPQTLERDLPLVIERVRAAGLAPVFVIDELDKVPDPEVSVAEIIGKLKHLITDFGFFCFLTDRRYYEYVRHVVQTSAFPPEHTFFSGRIFILYRSEEFKVFLGAVVDSDQPFGAPEWQNDDFAKKVFILCLLHRAKLNTVDVVREIARQCNVVGAVRATSNAIRSSPANHLAATVQLAVEHILKGRALKNRMDDEPIFAQLAVDALYRLSRAWEDERPDYEPGRDCLIQYLGDRIEKKPAPEPAPRRRAGAAAASAQQTAEATVLQVIGPVDIDLLVDEVERLERYMLDFNLLKSDLTSELPDEGLAFIDVIPIGLTTRLIEPKAGSRRYRFVFDAYGEYLQARVDEDAIGAEARAAVAGLETLCAAGGLTPELLIDFELLPRTIAWTEVKAAAAASANPNVTAAERNAALSRLETFVAALLEGPADQPRARRIAEVIGLVREIIVDAGTQASVNPRDAFQALAKYVDLRALIENRTLPLAASLANPPSLAALSAARASVSESLTAWSQEIVVGG